jgi:hypothetical protein
MKGKVIFLLNENNNRTFLHSLSIDKNKEKWEEIFR